MLSSHKKIDTGRALELGTFPAAPSPGLVFILSENCARCANTIRTVRDRATVVRYAPCSPQRYCMGVCVATRHRVLSVLMPLCHCRCSRKQDALFARKTAYPFLGTMKQFGAGGYVDKPNAARTTSSSPHLPFQFFLQSSHCAPLSLSVLPPSPAQETIH